jgi:hypothetical protein
MTSFAVTPTVSDNRTVLVRNYTGTFVGLTYFYNVDSCLKLVQLSNCRAQDLIISRLIYATPAFAGFLSGLQVTVPFNAAFRKSVKKTIIEQMFDAETLISDAEIQLFRRFKDNTLTLFKYRPTTTTGDACWQPIV